MNSIGMLDKLNLSCFSAALSSHLSGYRVQSQWVFQPNAECLRRGL